MIGNYILLFVIGFAIGAIIGLIIRIIIKMVNERKGKDVRRYNGMMYKGPMEALEMILKEQMKNHKVIPLNELDKWDE